MPSDIRNCPVHRINPPSPELQPCYCGNVSDDGWDEECTRECELEENENAK